MTQPNEIANEAVYTNTFGMNFVYIEPGIFIMGRTPYRENRGTHEFQHQVTLTKGYYFQDKPVTQAQWKVVMENNPSHFAEGRADAPVENVSWLDTQDFIEEINRIENSNQYRLPSEAEWEYAARAGSKTRFCYGDDYSQLDDYSWHKGNSGMKTHPVGQKKPNAWGLYDVIGNLWDWCQDWRGEYPRDKATDPMGPETGLGKVLRGGSWGSDIWYLHSTDRHSRPPEYRNYNAGFRLVKEL